MNSNKVATSEVLQEAKKERKERFFVEFQIAVEKYLLCRILMRRNGKLIMSTRVCTSLNYAKGADSGKKLHKTRLLASPILTKKLFPGDVKRNHRNVIAKSQLIMEKEIQGMGAISGGKDFFSAMLDIFSLWAIN